MESLTMKLGDGSTRVFYNKWEHGVIKESYYIDDTTGDKENINGGIPSVIFDIVVKTPYKMEKMIDRGSDKPWQGVLLDKKEVDEIKTKVMDSDDVYQLNPISTKAMRRKPIMLFLFIVILEIYIISCLR